MTVTQLTEVKCAQCHASETFRNLGNAQGAGWKTIDYRPIGSSPDVSSARKGDLCPACWRILYGVMSEIVLIEEREMVAS